MSRIRRKDSRSHRSRMGVAIVFDRMMLMISVSGMSSRRVIPKVVNLFAFPMRVMTAAMSHRNRIEMAAMGAPMVNTALVVRRRLNKYK